MFDKNYSVGLKPATPHYWAFYPNYFTADECDRIIQAGQKIEPLPSSIGNNVTNNSVRRGQVAFFDVKSPDTQWLFERMRKLSLEMNQQFWNFDISYLECIQFTRYEQPGDFYADHMDIAYSPFEHRKISLSVQLSDPDDYQGSDLMLFRTGKDMDTAPRDRGTVILFPSYHVHEVTPLIQGTRYSLVSWIVGPLFR